MTNRKKIEKFCKENELEIISLEPKRNTEAEKGFSYVYYYWLLIARRRGKVGEYDSYHGYDANTDVDLMLEDIKGDIEVGEFGE